MIVQISLKVEMEGFATMISPRHATAIQIVQILTHLLPHQRRQRRLRRGRRQLLQLLKGLWTPSIVQLTNIFSGPLTRRIGAAGTTTCVASPPNRRAQQIHTIAPMALRTGKPDGLSRRKSGAVVSTARDVLGQQVVASL